MLHVRTGVFAFEYIFGFNFNLYRTLRKLLRSWA